MQGVLDTNGQPWQMSEDVLAVASVTIEANAMRERFVAAISERFKEEKKQFCSTASIMAVALTPELKGYVCDVGNTTLGRRELRSECSVIC